MGKCGWHDFFGTSLWWLFMEIGFMQSTNRNTIKFDSVLNEAKFQDCTELYLIPHDKATSTYIPVFGATSILFAIFVSFFLSANILIASSFAVTIIAFTFCLLILFISISFMILGSRISLGLRKPKWHSPRWDARTKIAFYRLRNSDTKNPLCMELPGRYKPNDSWPLPFRRFYLSIISVFTRVDYLFTYDFIDTPLAYDIIPGILPRFKDIPEDVELSVQFSGAFYPNRIEKGSHGAVFAGSYANIHDVIEDQERYPGLAIVRHKDGYSELVVFTDKLEGGTWDEVKLRIFEAYPDAFPDKEIARLTALQNSLCEKGEL